MALHSQGINQTNEDIFITRSFIVFWSIVCALVPIILSIIETAFNKNILSSDPYASMWTWIVLSIIVFLPLSIPWLQWLVLRRLVNRLRLRVWLGTIVFSYILWQLSHYLFAMLQIHFSTTFEIFLLNSQDDSLSAIFSLQSLQLIVFNLINFMALSLIPSLVLGRYFNKSWLFFFVAASVGSIFMTLMEEIFNVLHIFEFKTALNGYDWKHRLVAFIYFGSVGATWGIFTMVALKHLLSGFKNKVLFVKDMFLSFVMMVVFIVLMYTLSLSKQHHDITITQLVFKFFSVTPQEDKFRGEHVLSKAKVVDIEPTKYPVINFSPNGQTFVMMDVDNQLVLIDTKSGVKLKNITKKINKDDILQSIWTPDGKYFIVRNSAENVPIANTHYSSKLSSITLYSIPEYKTQSSYTYRNSECFDTYDNSMAFDGNDTIWVLCGHHYSRPPKDSVLAYSLTIPTMKLLNVRKYEKEGIQIDDILQSENGAVSTQIEDDQIIMHYLSQNTNKIIVKDLNNSKLAGSLTKQYANIKDNNLELFFCGNSNNVSNPIEKQEDTKMIHGFCRTLIFDLDSGKLIQTKDDGRRKRLQSSSELYTDDYMIQSFWWNDSKKGEIIVKGKNLKVIQKIETTSQRLLAISSDSRWLVTYAFNENKIKIYEIHH